MKEAENFEDHWQEYSNQTIPPSKLSGAENFLQPVFKVLQERENLMILDAGCGDGVHACALSNRRGSLKTNRFMGVDISMSALRQSKMNANQEWRFMQADIGKLPFKANRFDVVFSYGVLGYTADPARSFAELCRVTKKEGLFGIWLSPPKSGASGILFHGIRKICQVGGSYFTSFIANLLVPFLGFLPTNSQLSLSNASWSQCHEVIMVNLAPDQLVFLSEPSVRSLFDENNIQILPGSAAVAPITIWGRKR